MLSNSKILNNKLQYSLRGSIYVLAAIVYLLERKNEDRIPSIWLIFETDTNILRGKSCNNSNIPWLTLHQTYRIFL